MFCQRVPTGLHWTHPNVHRHHVTKTYSIGSQMKLSRHPCLESKFNFLESKLSNRLASIVYIWSEAASSPTLAVQHDFVRRQSRAHTLLKAMRRLFCLLTRSITKCIQAARIARPKYGTCIRAKRSFHSMAIRTMSIAYAFVPVRISYSPYLRLMWKCGTCVNRQSSASKP